MDDKKAKAPKVPKVRLDQLLVSRNLAESREKARALIMAGMVVVGEHTVTKAGESVRGDSAIRLKGTNCPYVSRGGLKLKSALEHYALDVTGAVCLDIGASTGGFTDCLLQSGATRVYTIDVGTNQLAWSLRQDPRVVVRENFHVRDLTRDTIPEAIAWIVVDVSFISLTQALPPLFPFLKEGAGLLAMVKPQFEVGQARIGKHGVVGDVADQEWAVEQIAALLSAAGFSPQLPACPAGIKGPSGNQEYFLLVPPKLTKN